MKWLSLLLGVSLLGAASPALWAADEPGDKRPTREEMEKRKENWKKLSPEEREAKRKEIKARLEKRIYELRIKQTNETITATEARDLLRSEQILKRFEQAPPAPVKVEKVKSTNEPVAPTLK